MEWVENKYGIFELNIISKYLSIFLHIYLLYISKMILKKHYNKEGNKLI